MKKKILGAMLALFVTGFTFAQDDVPVEPRLLPASVKSGIAKYFGKKSVSSATKDREDGKLVYDVYFEDGTKAEFSSNGTLNEAKSHNGLSSKVVSSKIHSYVRRNYPNTTIVKWEKKWNKQKVELSNDVELEFNLRGDFLRIDD